MKKNSNIFAIDLPISFGSIRHIIKLVINNKSPIRIFHNYFLQNIEIIGKTIDLGSGNHSSYYDYLIDNSEKVFFADKVPKKKNQFKGDLEKKLEFNDNEFDTVILFNVLEHIENYKSLINEIFRILKKNGKLEIFIPFMHRFHPDPNDIFRPTHFYINKLLINAGFEVKTYLIGVGPLSVCSEILHKYAKFKIIKILLFLILILLDKIIKLFSKDYNTFYNGIHCTCEKK